MIQDTYSKKAVESWLENYQALIAGDSSADAPPSNSGPKAYDGINNRILIRIMLEDALSKLPEHLYNTVCHRWLMPVGRDKALDLLSCSKDVYYARCNKAVDTLHSTINGLSENYVHLLHKVTEIPPEC